jgi:hypothetical protein
MKDRTTLALMGVALALAGVAWWRGGARLALNGLLEGGKALLGVVPLLVAAFLVAGLIQALVTREMVTRWNRAGGASSWPAWAGR